jgi:hypothetical protein
MQPVIYNGSVFYDGLLIAWLKFEYEMKMRKLLQMVFGRLQHGETGLPSWRLAKGPFVSVGLGCFWPGSGR